MNSNYKVYVFDIDNIEGDNFNIENDIKNILEHYNGTPSVYTLKQFQLFFNQETINLNHHFIKFVFDPDSENDKYTRIGKEIIEDWKDLQGLENDHQLNNEEIVQMLNDLTSSIADRIKKGDI